MNSEWINIDKIHLWEQNPRINEHVIEQLAVSIVEFGFLNPLIVQKSSNRIIAGNTRYKAAQKLGLHKVPVIYTDLDDNKANAFAIADNKLGELALWDDDLLKELIHDLNDSEYNLDILGFDEYELESLLNDTLESSKIDFDEEIEEIEDKGLGKIIIECPLVKIDEIKETIETACIGYDEITFK